MASARFRGIKLKLTAVIVIAVLGTAGALTLITSLLVSYTLQQSLKQRAIETSKILSEALLGRQRQLAIRAEIVAQDQDFQTTFAFKDDELPRLQKDLSERTGKAGATASLVADLRGAPITSASTLPNLDGGKLAVATALKGARDGDKTVYTTEAIDGRVFFVAAVPIKRYGEQTLGYLVLAKIFDDPLVQQLKEAAGSDIFVVVGGQVRVGTSPLDSPGSLASVEARLGGAPIVPVDGMSAAGNPLLASAMQLRAGDKVQGGLIFALSARDARALQRQVLSASLALALGTMLVSGLIGLLVATRISNPIVEIEQSFREIAASGNLSQRITKSYSDEVGRMAGSFNKMQDQIEQLHARVVSAEQRMRDELKMASAVQEMLVPITGIDGARCQFASHSQTSTETGGDWFTICHSPELQLTTTIIADVTGHGAPSALVTAIIHGFFRATQDEINRLPPERWQEGVKDILSRLNTSIIESTRRSLACSLFLFTFDHRTLTARYVNCGHPAPVIVRRVNGQPQVGMLPLPPSTLIGDHDDPNFAWGEIQLEPEQLFFFYTDGLVECTNPAQEMYGFKRLRRTLSGAAHQDPRTVRDLVLQDALGFYGDMPRADDITIIVGRVR